jgi:hypothetical protein
MLIKVTKYIDEIHEVVLMNTKKYQSRYIHTSPESSLTKNSYPS